MYRLFDFLPSGNGYKIRLLLNQLRVPYHRVEVDILAGESRTPEFLQKNPNGRIPILEISPQQFLAESNAILFYLSQGTDFFPNNTQEQSKVMQWLFFEQYSHEPYIATSRYWISIIGKIDDYRTQLKQKQPLGYRALEVLENHLKSHDFLVGNRYSIADIGLYAYTHVAPEGGFDLDQFVAIQAWLGRVREQANHILITERPSFM